MAPEQAPADSLTRAAELLRRDVASTVGPTHCAEVNNEEATLRTEGVDETETQLVERVQQAFHDLFVDTTWPACPRHPRHPMWYQNGAWWCEQDGEAIVPLGELSRRQAAV